MNSLPRTVVGGAAESGAAVNVVVYVLVPAAAVVCLGLVVLWYKLTNSGMRARATCGYRAFIYLTLTSLVPPPALTALALSCFCRRVHPLEGEGRPQRGVGAHL